MDTQSALKREEEGQNVSENHDWSKLCPDLLRKIIESLSSIDFFRAKTVCSDWYSVWKTCVKQPLCPWRIIYEDDSLMLFDPREDKIYTTKLLGLSDKSYFMASSGNWLLMVNSRVDFYIFNLVTRKRIYLPSLKCSLEYLEPFPWSGHLEWRHLVEPFPKDRVWKDIIGCKRSAVVWINERTGDYVVAWIFKQHYLFTHKNGDDSWRNWNCKWKSKGRNLACSDLAYKNSKLYLYTMENHIKIIDFSGDFPKEEIENNPYQDLPFHYDKQAWEYIMRKRIAIQKSGEVLIILSLIDESHEDNCLFYIFKMNLESNKWERVDSVGDDEMLIFGHGVTIRAPVQDVGDGIKNGLICFVKDDIWPGYGCPSHCGVFDLATSRVTWTNKLGVNITRIEWFVPGFA